MEMSANTRLVLAGVVPEGALAAQGEGGKHSWIVLEWIAEDSSAFLRGASLCWEWMYR